MSYDAMIEWMRKNYSSGSLHDIPDDLLAWMMQDKDRAISFTVLCCQASMLESDEPPMLNTVLPQAAERVYKWLIVERLRRLGKVGLDEYMFVKELATTDTCGLVISGQPFTGTIVEVMPGVVTLVGEEIKLG